MCVRVCVLGVAPMCVPDVCVLRGYSKRKHTVVTMYYGVCDIMFV